MHSEDRHGALDEQLLAQLESHKTPPAQLETVRADEGEMDRELLSYAQLSPQEECAAALREPYDAWNHLIDADAIEFVFASDDAELARLFDSVAQTPRSSGGWLQA